MGRKYRTFEDKQEWIDYVTKYMAKATRLEGVNQVILQTHDAETIAVWQRHGSGCIYEARSDERLQETRNA